MFQSYFSLLPNTYPGQASFSFGVPQPSIYLSHLRAFAVGWYGVGQWFSNFGLFFEMLELLFFFK